MLSFETGRADEKTNYLSQAIRLNFWSKDGPLKHFTPQRLARLQDRSDKKRYLRALKDWERAVESYREHLAKTAKQLPKGVARLLHTVSLHDAQVIDIWQKGNRFNITLRPSADQSNLVVLRYTLLEHPAIRRDALEQNLRSSEVIWLYDEWGGPLALADRGARSVFSHDILLANGWEIRLRFLKVVVSRPSALVPAAS